MERQEPVTKERVLRSIAMDNKYSMEDRLRAVKLLDGGESPNSGVGFHTDNPEG